MKKKPSFIQACIRKIKLIFHIDTTAVGLEISDQALRLCHFREDVGEMSTIRLAPGVIEAGRIRDREAFLAALGDLKEIAFGKKGRRMKCNVAASLSSADVYSQLFNLPVIEGENLDKAIALNLQMASPSGDAGSYSGWQIARKDLDQMRYEIVSVFVDRSIVDDLVAVFLEAGLTVVSLESKALSLARVLTQRADGIDPQSPYLILWMDDTGIDLIIVRGGKFYFEYRDPWREIMDAKGEISEEAFESAIVKTIRQIANFYGQHWSDTVKAIAIGPASMYDRIAPIVGPVAGQPLIPLAIASTEGYLAPDSFVALGAGLRGLDIDASFGEMNLLGADAEVTFQKERFLGFMRFWGVTLSLSLSLLILIMALGDVFLADTNKSLAMSVQLNSSAATQQLQDLTSQASAFNREVALVHSVESGATGASRGDFLAAMQSLAAANGITISHLQFVAPGQPATLTGAASSQNAVLDFKKALESASGTSSVDLPLSGIQPANGGFSFTLTFVYLP